MSDRSYEAGLQDADRLSCATGPCSHADDAVGVASRRQASLRNLECERVDVVVAAPHRCGRIDQVKGGPRPSRDGFAAQADESALAAASISRGTNGHLGEVLSGGAGVALQGSSDPSHRSKYGLTSSRDSQASAR